MRKCWNGFCIAEDCGGAEHYDATGRSWKQKQGEEYCPLCHYYHRPEWHPVPTEAVDKLEKLVSEYEDTRDQNGHPMADQFCEAWHALAGFMGQHEGILPDQWFKVEQD